MRRWIRFSLLSLLVAVTLACAYFAYLHASLYKREPFAYRVYGLIGGELRVSPFRTELLQHIEDMGFERLDSDDQARELASYWMVHHDCIGEPVVYRGSFTNGKVFYIHCYFTPNPPQPDITLYSIAVSFFETPYERWKTKEFNQLQARDTALLLRAESRELFAKQWHAEQRRIKGLPPE